jgi:hypothetical protein
MQNPGMGVGPGMGGPGMMNPQMMAMQGVASDPESIFEESQVLEINQEKHCLKPLCVGCIQPDKFTGKTLLSSFVTEESDWCHRNCTYRYTCFTKPTSLNFDVGSVNALKYTQSCRCGCFTGHFGDVWSPKLGQLGQAGMPISCCSCKHGMKNCCLDLASWGSLCGAAVGVHICSLETCLCNGMKVFPTRLWDNNKTLTYNVTSKYCQPGVCIGPCCPCDSCQTITWDVETPAEQQVATIIRRDLRECCGCRPGSQWKMNFTPNNNRRDREMIFAAALSLQMLYFDV